MIPDIGYFNIFHPFFHLFHPCFIHFSSIFLGKIVPSPPRNAAHFIRVGDPMLPASTSPVCTLHCRSRRWVLWRIHGERNNPTYYIRYILYLIYINFVFQEYLNSIWVRQPRFVFVQTFDICIFHRLGPWLTGSSSSSASKNPNEGRWFSQRFDPAIFHISPGENPAKCGKNWEKSSWDTYLVISYIANWKITTSNR